MASELSFVSEKSSPGGGPTTSVRAPAASRALPTRDDHGDYDKRAARDRPEDKPWYKRMEDCVGIRKGVEQPVRVLKNPFLVALVAFVLCSCGGDSTAGGSSPRGDTVERTSAEDEVPGQTSSPGKNPADGERSEEHTSELQSRQ